MGGRKKSYDATLSCKYTASLPKQLYLLASRIAPQKAPQITPVSKQLTQPTGQVLARRILIRDSVIIILFSRFGLVLRTSSYRNSDLY